MSASSAALDFLDVVVKTNLSKKTKGPFQTRGHFLSLSLAVAATLNVVLVVKTNFTKKKGPFQTRGNFLLLSSSAAATLNVIAAVKKMNFSKKTKGPF